jgi:hypothetical protein
MALVAQLLTMLAFVAFVMAVATNYIGEQFMTTAEGYSRAAGNLALLAIAVTLAFGPRTRS